MRTSTPSTPRSSSCSTRRCAASRSPSAAAWCSPPPMRPRRSACAAACRDGGRASSARSSIFVGGHFNEYQRLGDAAIERARRFHAAGRAHLDRRGLRRRRRLHASVRPAGRDRRRRSGAACGPSSACRSRSASRAPSISPRSPRRWPSPTGWWSSIPATELAFLHDLPVELMWGVGPVTKARLAEIGVAHHRAAGEDAGMVAGAAARPAAGREAGGAGLEPRPARDQDASPRALGRRAVGARQEARRGARSSGRRCRHLADRVATRLRAKSRPGRTVTVRVRFADLRSVTRSVTLDAPISATAILAEIAEELVRGVLADHPDEKTISLLAISVSHLEEHAGAAAGAAARPCRRGAPPRHQAGHGALRRRPRRRRDPRPLRLGGGRLRLGGARDAPARFPTRSASSPRRSCEHHRFPARHNPTSCEEALKSKQKWLIIGGHHGHD